MIFFDISLKFIDWIGNELTMTGCRTLKLGGSNICSNMLMLLQLWRIWQKGILILTFSNTFFHPTNLTTGENKIEKNDV